MKHTTALKIAISLEICCGLLSMLSDRIFSDTLPVAIQALNSNRSIADLNIFQKIGILFALPLIVGQVAAWISLWNLWKRGRLIYTACTLMGIPTTYLLIKPFVCQTGVGAFFSEIASVASGIILGLIYFTDLKNNFIQEKTPNKAFNSDAE